MQSYKDIKEIIDDVAAIRRGLELGTGLKIKQTPTSSVLFTKRAIQVGVLALSGTLLMIEAVFDHYNTRLLILAAYDDGLVALGIANMAGMLIVMMAALYFVVQRAAQKSDQGLTVFITENFSYLRNFSLFTDLFIKFSILSLILLGHKTEWFAPILTLFTADYLLQGRFFVLPVKLSLVLGLFAIAAAYAQFLSAAPELLWPLLIFVTVSAVSTFRSVYSEYA